nr:unnamed protein product [Callosobruchus analis]
MATGGRRRKILHIIGADGITTKEEVNEAIKKTLKIDGETFVVRSARPAYGGTLNFTLEMEEANADALLAIGTLKLGLLKCQVRERINLARCFKCKNFGHIELCGKADKTSESYNRIIREAYLDSSHMHRRQKATDPISSKWKSHRSAEE